MLSAIPYGRVLLGLPGALRWRDATTVMLLGDGPYHVSYALGLGESTWLPLADQCDDLIWELVKNKLPLVFPISPFVLVPLASD